MLSVVRSPFVHSIFSRSVSFLQLRITLTQTSEYLFISVPPPLLLFFFPFFSMCALDGLFFIAENGVRMYDSFHSFAVTMRHLRLSFRRSVPINKIFDGIRNTVHARTLARTHTRPQADHKTGKNTIWTYAASTSSPSPSYTFHHFYAFRPKQTNERATKIIFVWIFPEDDRIDSEKKILFSAYGFQSLARRMREQKYYFHCTLSKVAHRTSCVSARCASK